MRKIKVKFTALIDECVSDDEIQEWLDFNLVGGSVSNKNPLNDLDIEAQPFSVEFED